MNRCKPLPATDPKASAWPLITQGVMSRRSRENALSVARDIGFTLYTYCECEVEDPRWDPAYTFKVLGDHPILDAYLAVAAVMADDLERMDEAVRQGWFCAENEHAMEGSE